MTLLLSIGGSSLGRAVEGITTAEGTTPHTQTVARIIDFLEKLGKDDVEQTKRHGKKLVVVDEEAADRYHDRCNRDIEQPPAGSVMS